MSIYTISFKKESAVKSKFTAEELIKFYFISRKAKSNNELKTKLCLEFKNKPEMFDLSDPFDKKRYESFVNLCKRKGVINEFIESEENNWSENIVNLNECSLFTHNFTLTFKYSPTNNEWISTTKPQSDYCGMIVITRLHLDPSGPFWHYSDTHIVTNRNESFGIDSSSKSCSKFPKSETSTYYGIQKFSKKNGFNGEDISSSRNTIYMKCDRIKLS
ncbi:TPA: hypothetical protein ACF6GP_000789 [Legionella pneumophila]